MIHPARAVIVAAGAGRRFGAPKQFAELRGRRLLDRCLDRFQAHPAVEEIVLVLGGQTSGPDYRSLYDKISAVVPGGKERQDSVAEGLRRLSSAPEDIVLIHDGVRPLVTEGLIDEVLEAARRTGAAVPVLPVTETIKKVADRRIQSTLDREPLRRVQTPQAFRFALLHRALDLAQKDHFVGTDDAVLVERMGHPVEAVPGDWRNIKITTPEDLRMAEVLLDL